MGEAISLGQSSLGNGFGDTVDLRLLRCFVAVADAGSVTAAALELYVSQSSLSRQLHRLQRDIGLVLFRPVDGRLVVTSAGRELLPRARALLARGTAVRSFARAIASGAITAVQIAASAVNACDVLAAFIAAAPDGLPPLSVRSTETGQLYEALDGDADLVVDENVPPGHLAVMVLARRPLGAFVPTTHELAGNESVTLTELVEHQLILPDAKGHVRRIIDGAIADEGLIYRTAGEYDCPPVAMANAAAGRGVAVACGDPAFDLVQLPVMTTGGPMTAPLFASWRADHHAASILADLASGLSNYLVSQHGLFSVDDLDGVRSFSGAQHMA